MKALSTRTHICKCGCELDRDHQCRHQYPAAWTPYPGAQGNVYAGERDHPLLSWNLLVKILLGNGSLDEPRIPFPFRSGSVKDFLVLVHGFLAAVWA